MATLSESRYETDAWSQEEKAGLITYLLDSPSGPALGPDDAEVARRAEEMDSGAVEAISHEQFLAEVGGE